MARLGKREREAKRALIKSNLANLKGLERSSGTRGSTLELSRVLRHTHTMGAHVGMGRGVRSDWQSKPKEHGNATPNTKMGDGRAAHVAKRV